MNDIHSTWNLADMFESDAAWEKKLSETAELIDRLAAKKGSAAASAADLLETARLYEQCNNGLEQTYVYASCKYHPDLSVDSAKGMVERVMTEINRFGEKTAFLAPELMQYSMEKFEEYCAVCPELAVYRHYAEDFFAKKEHVLNQKGEEMLAKALPLADKIYETVLAAM